METPFTSNSSTSSLDLYLGEYYKNLHNYQVLKHLVNFHVEKQNFFQVLNTSKIFEHISCVTHTSSKTLGRHFEKQNFFQVLNTSKIVEHISSVTHKF